jgi:DHA1 family tetracycline resistance protein-like MFS transporter
MRSAKPALAFILVTVMLDVLGFALLIPIAPRLVESLLHGGNGGTDAEAAPMVSLLMTTWYGMSFLFSPTLGSISDRVGRRPVLLISLFGTGVDFFAQAISPNLTWLFVTRAINGLSGASMTVANAYVADITPPQKRAGAFGMLYAAFGLGFVIGPLLGGWLGDPTKVIPLVGHGNIRFPFYVAGTLTLLNWLYGLFVLPESLPRERRSHLKWSRMNPVGAYGALGHYPLVLKLAAVWFFVNMAQFGLHATWVLYTKHRYQWESMEVGASLAVVGICAIIVQGGLARRIIPAIGEKRAMIFGLAMATLTYMGYGLARHGWVIYVIIAVASTGGIWQPAFQSLITRTVRPDEQGAVQGTLSSLMSVAGIIGPLLGGTAFNWFVNDDFLQGAPFFVSSLLCVIALAIALWSLGAPLPQAGGEPVTPPH